MLKDAGASDDDTGGAGDTGLPPATTSIGKDKLFKV